MVNERALAGSPRFARLIEKFKDREYRHSYVVAHTRRFLARQMRKFRGGRSQAAFAEVLGKQPTQVQRLEDPTYGKHTLQTLFEVAGKLDLAVFVRLVDHRTFLRLSADLSEDAFEPLPYEDNEKRAAEQMAKGDAARALDNFLQETFKSRPLPPPIEPANENRQEDRDFSEQRRMRA
jgi:transcriptional regulator with XRE-family HTH domain